MHAQKQELSPKSTFEHTKSRAILTAEQAIKIFQIKLSNDTAVRGQRLTSCSVARAFGVSEKAVRDIWKGRTWLRETQTINSTCIELQTEQLPPRNPRFKVQSSSSGKASCSKNTLLQHVRVPVEAAEILHSSLSPPPTSAAISTSVPDIALPVTHPHAWWHQAFASIEDDLTPASVTTLLCDWGWLSSTAEAAPLPVSSRPDDPFHDDWRYWPSAGSTGQGLDYPHLLNLQQI